MIFVSKKKEKILVAMSGGVDSSVAAALLVREGYDVTGMFTVNYNANIRIDANATNNECWAPDYRDAVRVAAKLGIPLLKLNFQKEYKKFVLDYMYKEYSAGRTPNPDVLCNKFIKFGVWFDAARKLGFDKLATGHYAKIRTTKDTKLRNTKKLSPITYHLSQANDANKDQTYFLNQLNQEQLKHILFPLGNYLKFEVRGLARRFDLPTAEKEESMGICFVGEVNMKVFLQKKIKIKKGDIILSDGTKIGEHDGLAFYTIGQRHFGANIVIPAKAGIQKKNGGLYIVDKNMKKNQLIVGYENDPLLYKKEITVDNINWISGQKPAFPLKCMVRLRHRQPLQVCHCKGAIIGRRSNPNVRKLKVEFKKPQRAPTPGQFAVFYKNKECLGGGVIEN